MIGMLAVGDVIEALDFAGGVVWGTVPRLGRVGYIAQDALAALGDID